MLANILHNCNGSIALLEIILTNNLRMRGIYIIYYIKFNFHFHFQRDNIILRSSKRYNRYLKNLLVSFSKSTLLRIHVWLIRRTPVCEYCYTCHTYSEYIQYYKIVEKTTNYLFQKNIQLKEKQTKTNNVTVMYLIYADMISFNLNEILNWPQFLLYLIFYLKWQFNMKFL